MFRTVLIVVVLAGLIGAGILEGLRSNRWGVSEDLVAAAKKLDAVPAAWGDWTSVESPIAEKLLAVAEASGNVSRVYTNRKTGQVVNVLILCGPAGPIGSHTPDVCYAGNGFAMQGKERRISLTTADGSIDSFWTARFEKPGPNEPALEVVWAWGVDGEWRAADSPRTEFALRNALYKIYVTRPVEPVIAGKSPGSGPYRGF